MAEIPENCWAIAAGDTDRSYADLCIEHGVIMMGPGNPGSWADFNIKGKYQDRYSARMCGILQKFYSIAPGDLIVLRLGTSEVHGVGYVSQKNGALPGHSYHYSDFFADVDGWDLQHFHYVRWIWAKPDRKPRNFPKALNMGDTTQKLSKTEKNKEIFNWIEGLEDSGKEKEIGQKIFSVGKKLEVRDITTKLYDYGFGSGAISTVDERISDLCRLARWYRTYDIFPSEAETVSHLVTPLLLSLGWTPQRIALEYFVKGQGRVDLALFSNGNRQDYQPVAIVEAKRLNQSCLNASDQIKRYASELQEVRRLIVTDGIRYGVFIRPDGKKEFSNHLAAYMNLASLRDSYPIYGEDCGGADEVMLTLSSAWDHEFLAPNITKIDVAPEQERVA
jgi:hypothetical protein